MRNRVPELAGRILSNAPTMQSAALSDDTNMIRITPNGRARITSECALCLRLDYELSSSVHDTSSFSIGPYLLHSISKSAASCTTSKAPHDPALPGR